MDKKSSLKSKVFESPYGGVPLNLDLIKKVVSGKYVKGRTLGEFS